MASLPRSAWTTTTPRGAALAVARIRGLTPHWPGSTGRYLTMNRSQVAAALRGWRDFHVRVRGWSDIGYNWAVDGNGDDWELRGDRVGAHAGAAHNPVYIGVLFVLGIGEEPNAKMLAAFRRLRARLLKRYPGAVLVIDHGTLPGTSTACAGPGVRGANRRGALIATGTITVPTPAPAPQRQEFLDMAIHRQWVRTQPIALTPGRHRYLPLQNDHEGPHSILVSHRLVDVDLEFEIEGLPAGRELQLRAMFFNPATGAYGGGGQTIEIVGTGGKTFGQISYKGIVPRGRRLRVRALTFDDGVKITRLRTSKIYGPEL